MCDTSLIEHQEGFRSHGYDDANDHPLGAGYTIKGNATVGFGFNIGPNGEGLSEAECRLVMNYRLGKLRKRLSGLYSWFDGLDRVRQAAVESSVYNLGLPNFNAFKHTIAAFEQGNFAEAAYQMRDSDWYRNAETRHRAGECAQMVETGKWPEGYNLPAS